MITPEGKVMATLSGSPSLDDLLNTSFALFPSAVTVRRDAFERCGGFPETFARAGFEDIFAALLFREQGEFIHIPRPLVVYHGSRASVLVAKYEQGFTVFRRLLIQRFGTRAKRQLAIARRYYVSLLLGATAEAIHERKAFSATLNLAKAVLVNPFYVSRRLFTRFFTHIE
jgi:GT2 family glycosyltransferase